MTSALSLSLLAPTAALAHGGLRRSALGVLLGEEQEGQHMSASNHHQVSAYYDAGNFIARCSTCNWTGQWRHERQNAVSDATLHLAGSIRMEDMTITTSSGMRRYSKAEYARWFEQHTCRLERDRACAAQHHDPIEPTKAEVLAGERLREYLEALEVLTYRTLHVLRRDGVPVLTSIDQDIEAALEMNQQAVTDLERRMRHHDRCFPQIGLIAFNGRRHSNRLANIAADRRVGRHAYAWHEQQPEGGCVVRSCGVMVLGTLNHDFTEAEFVKATGHRPGRA